MKRYNGIIAIKRDPEFTEAERAALKNVAGFVDRLPETREYTDLDSVVWVAAQVNYGTFAEIEALVTALQARDDDPDSLVAAQAALQAIADSVGVETATTLQVAITKKGNGAVQAIGLWDAESLGPDGQALQQGYHYVWDETAGSEGETIRSNERIESNGEAILIPFNRDLYLALQGDDVVTDSDGNETARTRPTTPKQWNRFSGWPERDLEVRA